MRRREFLYGLGSAAVAWPSRAGAQQPMPVVGYLGSETPTLFATRLAAFRKGLAAAGYVEGRNVAIEYRWAEGQNNRLPALAAELVRARVSVIAAPGSLASALAAKAASSTIPIVFETGADPIVAGLVASLNRPGGNITGITSLNAQVGPKRLELLHELIPGASTFALLVNPTNPRNAEATSKSLQAAASGLKLRLQVLEASTEPEIDKVFSQLGQRGVRGLVIANETFFANRSEHLAAQARRTAMPAVHQSREFAVAGGLMSYGGDVMESHGQTGAHVARILKGEAAANLPVQQVTKIHMAVNLKAAKELGLHVPHSMVARADEIVE